MKLFKALLLLIITLLAVAIDARRRHKSHKSKRSRSRGVAEQCKAKYPGYTEAKDCTGKSKRVDFVCKNGGKWMIHNMSSGAFTEIEAEKVKNLGDCITVKVRR